MTAFDISPPLLGAHFSIAGGLERAVSHARHYNCNTFQIFTKNASTWKERTVSTEEAACFRAALADAEITAVASHASYLINVASPDPILRKRSTEALAAELNRAHQLGIPWVVLHPGAHMGDGMANGISRAAESIRNALSATATADTRLLIETTAGQGTGIGHLFEHIADIIHRVDREDRLGVCLDTCHVFAAGYDLRDGDAVHTVLDAVDAVLGLDRLRVIHLNDALRPLGSRVDRHAHIGRGEIGDAGFAALMTHPTLAPTAKILETPKGARGEPDWDRINLDRLRQMAAAGKQKQ